MNDEQILIFDYLNNFAQGYANRKSSSDIRDYCNLPAGDATNVYVRNLITDMIINHGCCIGSKMWKSGYWIIQNETELKDVCDSIEDRANSTIKRSNALKNNWNNSDL